MKTLIVTALLFLASSLVIAQSQIRKGVYSISGSISLTSGSSSFQDAKQTSTSFEFSPSVSLFVSDVIEVTCAPSFSRSSSEIDFPGQPVHTSSGTGLGIGLGARYYFPLETTALFIGAGGGLSWSKFGSGDFYNTFTPATKTYNFAVGFDYFVAQALAIEPQFQYRGTERETATSNGIFASIGVKYFIL